MPEPVAVESETGAQLLPADQGHDYRRLTPWHAHLACDADLRTRALPYRDVASRITITYPKENSDD